MAGTCLGPVGPASGFDSTSARPDSAVITSASDSVYTLPAIVVRAARLTRQEELDLLPGAATVIELDDLHSRIASTAEVIERVPGLHVRDYGSLGTYSTVSIRGSTSQQVTVYLDGVPLMRAGLGVVNLADLPFAALERIEVYRGFAPSALPGAGLGGAINLVTRRPKGARGESTVLLGGGSYDTQRIGLTHRIGAGSWDALAVADRWESSGDFRFHDDNGTWSNPTDDTIATRSNNIVEHNEILAQITHPLARSGNLRLANQWVRRRQGVPGISNNQSLQARAGVDYDITSLECRTPRFAADHLTATVRLSHDWRRDRFVDPAGEIGLGYFEDNSDVSRAWGARAVVEATASDFAVTVLDASVQRETFQQWQLLPSTTQGPTHRRVQQEAGIEERLRIGAHFGIHVGLRWTKVRSEIAADSIPTPPRPARTLLATDREPRAGVRLQVWRGLQARASAGKYHRTPGFLELFHDGGTIRGTPGLVAESGTNRDAGLQWDAMPARTSLRLEATHFDRDVDNLISLRYAANTYVATNIGRANMRGEEYAWSWSDVSPARRWSLEGNYTQLRTTDTSTNTSVYVGLELPLQPRHQFFQRVAVRARGCEFGYEFDHVGHNFLNQWNTVFVSRRDLHAVDMKLVWRALALHAGVRNLTDERVADVAKFPLPGRTFFATSSVRF